MFINEYIRYLVQGAEDESCVSSLAKAIQLLTDPRFEYSSCGDDHPYDRLFPTVTSDQPKLPAGWQHIENH